MTAPTREQVEEWWKEARDVALAEWQVTGCDFAAAIRYHASALAFAAGQSEPVANRAAEYSTPSTAGGGDDLRDLLRRCRRYVEADAQMMADITRHAPLDAKSQAEHDTTEYESETLLPLIDAALAGDARPCTCHPDDNPPKPCPRKYALNECRAAVAGSGAELVRELEADVGALKTYVDVYKVITCKYIRESPYWDRLKAALLAGDAAREDAARLDFYESNPHAIGYATGYRGSVSNWYSRKDGYVTDAQTLREAIDRAREGSDA